MNSKCRSNLKSVSRGRTVVVAEVSENLADTLWRRSVADRPNYIFLDHLYLLLLFTTDKRPLSFYLYKESKNAGFPAHNHASYSFFTENEGREGTRKSFCYKIWSENLESRETKKNSREKRSERKPKS